MFKKANGLAFTDYPARSYILMDTAAQILFGRPRAAAIRPMFHCGVGSLVKNIQQAHAARAKRWI
jgi:hypothetical protein